MIQFEILAISILRVLIEVAGYSLLGQGLLAILAGARREEHLFYRILKTITSPVIRAVRFITPRFVRWWWYWAMIAAAQSRQPWKVERLPVT